MSELTETQRNLVGTAISAMLPPEKRFILIVTDVSGPFALEVITDLAGQAGIASTMCRWAADVVGGTEDEKTSQMLLDSGAKLVS